MLGPPETLALEVPVGLLCVIYRVANPQHTFAARSTFKDLFHRHDTRELTYLNRLRGRGCAFTFDEGSWTPETSGYAGLSGWCR